MSNLKDKVLGCIIGGAVGDALGAPFEGLWSRDIPEPLDLISGYAHFEGYPSGQYTDDTQLTIATLSSIIECRFINPHEIAKSIFALWKNLTVIGPGGACGQAATEFFRSADWTKCGAAVGNAGNGTAMRTSALAFCFLKKPNLLPIVVGDICRITHKDPRSVAGGVAIAQASLILCRSKTFEPTEFCESIANAISVIDSEMAQLVLGLPRVAKLDRASALKEIAWAGMKYPEFEMPIITPFVVPTILGSLWAIISNPDSWSDAVTFALKLGGDVDTLGAIVGGLMGAKLGFDSLPAPLAKGVVRSAHLKKLAEKYHVLISDEFHSRGLFQLYDATA